MDNFIVDVRIGVENGLMGVEGTISPIGTMPIDRDAFFEKCREIIKDYFPVRPGYVRWRVAYTDVLFERRLTFKLEDRKTVITPSL